MGEGATNMKSILPCSMVIIFVTIFTGLGVYPLPSPGSNTGNDMNYICNEQDSDLT